mgnify:CR=1 FL=1|tara:strand:+ start:47 stop:205 length:159 start_codon:yes stop_codon:yes gene_type:complete
MEKALENLKKQLEANYQQKFKILGAIEVLTQLIEGEKKDDRNADADSTISED